MSNSNAGLTYTVQENEGIWFQLWWDGQECLYSEDLKAQSREDAEKEATQVAATSSPLERVMEALGCEQGDRKDRDYR